VRIDDRHPTYRDVGLGTSLPDLVRVLGTPHVNSNSHDMRTVPSGEDFYALGLPVNGPTPPPAPAGSGHPRSDIRTVSYRHVVFLASTGPAGVYYFAVSGHSVRTSRDVGVGDSLAQARRAYGSILHCETANSGAEYPSFPYCGARLGPHLYLYFGKDPIRSIAFASTWLPPG
jgi:hypothetical protein